jgi:dienelactone hydrolase
MKLQSLRRQAVRWLALGIVCLVLAGVALFTSCRTRRLPVPTGVTASTIKVNLTGKNVPVDLYVPQGIDRAPVVVIAHGFSRSRKNMAGWGSLLASNGFIAAALDMPAWADHGRNGRAIAELLESLQSGRLVKEPVPLRRGAVVGFSAGGYATLAAAAGNSNVHCWVGLDPVDAGTSGASLAKELQIPAVVLRAEPASWNANGNCRAIIRDKPGPLFACRIKGATHVDPESPTDGLAELACGKYDATRHAAFERYAVAGLRAVLFGDAASLALLKGATNDTALADVQLREPGKFRLR